MYVPKWLTYLVLAVGTLCVGWILNNALGGTTPASAASNSSDRDELVEGRSSQSSQQRDDNGTAPPIALTIVLGDGAEPKVTTAPTGSPKAANVGSGTTSQLSSTTGQLSSTTGQLSGLTGSGSTSTPSRLISRRTTVAVPRHQAPPTSDPAGVGRSQSADHDRFTFLMDPETAATAIGEHIVIAYDDSIVLVGDHGRLNGNTGDAGQGGVVALDAQSSAFSTSPDPTGGTTAPQSTTGMIAPTPANRPVLAASGSLATPAGYAPTTGYAPNYVPNAPGVVSPLIAPIVSFSDGRPVDIAGFEDHSLSVRGLRNVVTYDDSNVWIDRDGKLNGNTGDTDSSGLNAVDSLRSNISAGPHCDDGCDNESIIQAQAGVFDEGDVAIDGDGHVVFAPDSDAPSDSDDSDDSLPEDNGDDDDSVDDESDDGDLSDPREPAETLEEADSTREAADSGEDFEYRPSGDALVIGGDGYDDLGLRIDGVDQVVTYDDSNVVIGGTGDVNSQIGDSDTGGTVTMGTVDSEVQGGNSR